MLQLDLTLATPEENLACDEALLELCEARPGLEVLRFWESSEHFVVMGMSNRIEAEVRLDECRRAGLRVLRRASGGGAVVQGPGSLSYAVILRIAGPGAGGGIHGTFGAVLDRHRAALGSLLGRPVEFQPPSDLAVGGRKFSGNAQRRRTSCALVHGTILYDFDLALMERFLPLPPRQPAYRRGRAHAAFVTNLPLSAAQIKEALIRAWDAFEPLVEAPGARVAALVEGRYSRVDWIRRL